MYKAAFYETEITPPIGSFIPGHYARVYGRGVKDKLYVKSLVIDNGSVTVAMAVVDCVELPWNCHDSIVKRIGDYTDIKAENIIIAANHTHAGASTKSYEEIKAYADDWYIDHLIKLTADCVILAYRNLQPVSISYECGKVYDISFNRNFVMRDGTIKTNVGRDNEEIVPINIPDDIPFVKFEDAHNCPGAKIINPNCAGNLDGIDPDVPFVMFKNEAGEYIGAIVNFACHQTASGASAFSGDYSSILSKELKKTYGSDFVSLFMVGACGDINHVDFSKKECEPDVYKKMGTRIADEVRSLEKNAEEINGDFLFSIKEKLVLKRRQADYEALSELMNEYIKTKSNSYKGRLRNALVYDARGYGEELEAYVQCIRLGDVYIYALPGEMFVHFGRYIKENSPSDKVIITELANGPYDGYVPTREAFHKNSYLYEKAVCEGSCMEPEGGYIVSDKALEFADKLSKM